MRSTSGRSTATWLSVTALILGFLGGNVPETAEASQTCTAGTATETTSGNTVVVTFRAPATGNASCTWTVPNNVFVVDYLVVAGGGGGSGGGGGGGGVVTSWEGTDTNPQTVRPGESISVVVGGGGAGGWGGRIRCSGSCTITDPAGRASISASGETSGRGYPATDGANSSFGQVVAVGGGGGGWYAAGSEPATPNTADGNDGNWRRGRPGGSSGGNAADVNGGTVASTQTSVTGAVAYGNAGGSGAGGSYNGGGGGGGASAVGGNARQVPADLANGNHGGGHGGAGVTIDITGSNVIYGCGGGAGVNANTNAYVTNGGGNGGCANAGDGSDAGVNLTTGRTSFTDTSRLASAGTDGTGGGGGGTDPEDTRGANGGDGIVVLRYVVVDSNCPNNSSASVSTPVACPAELVITAGAGSSHVQVLGSPISYSSGTAAASVVSRPRANPTSGNLTITATGNGFDISAPSGSSLIGGTYPVMYRITEGSSTSDSYILVTVEDPEQLTPYTIAVDPRETSITLPAFDLGTAPNVLLCVTVSDSVSPVPTISAPAATGVTQQSRTRGLSFSGTRANVEAMTGTIEVTQSGTNPLVPSSATTRILTVNVSNTENGGNNSCVGGTSSEVEIKKLSIRSGVLVGVNF